MGGTMTQIDAATKGLWDKLKSIHNGPVPTDPGIAVMLYKAMEGIAFVLVALREITNVFPDRDVEGFLRQFRRWEQGKTHKHVLVMHKDAWAIKDHDTGRRVSPSTHFVILSKWMEENP